MQYAKAKSEFEVAQIAGNHICECAFWYGSRCNWVGRESKGPLTENDTPTNKALSSEIYAGTSGIATFLANLFMNRKIDDYRRTAEGAIEQALSRIKDIPEIARFGFYTGRLGIAYTAVKLGIIFNSYNLMESGLHEIQNLSLNQKAEHLIDLMSGNAGAIPALLDLYKMTDDENNLKLAINLGKEFLSNAIKESYGWSWDYRKSGVLKAHHNLTGFSHGAAGIGYALLELFDQTDQKEFFEAAMQSFRYENYWFNKENNNWPDFRDLGINEQNTKKDLETKEFRYTVAWCHGAPGIGLSRLRAYQIFKDKKYLDSYCNAALETTKRIAKSIHRESYDADNFSLCHGLSGIGEILLFASDVLNDSSCRSLALDIGSYGIEKYVNEELPWPYELGGETPGLMLGLSGIGNFYLRLCHPHKIMFSPLIIIPSG